MLYEIEAGGRLRDVTVSRTGDGFAVQVDGRTYHVDPARIDGHSLSLIVDRGVSAGPQVYDVIVAPEGGPGRLVVHVGVVPVTILPNGRGRRGKATLAGGGAAGSGPLRITAPMPGKVVRVLVNTGDRVRARQPVIVVEAMKMENELRADRDGTVAEVQAREGTSVEAGALLVIIQ